MTETDSDLIEEAIHRVLRENPYDAVGNNANSRLVRDENDMQLLLKLLDQLNLLRAERDQKGSFPKTMNPENSASVDLFCCKDNLATDVPAEAEKVNQKISNEELVRELRTVKKQNKFTNVVLGIMFVTSAIWRLSELLMVLRIRKTISNPFRTIGGFIIGNMTEHNGGPHLPHLEGPSLPHIERPSLNDILHGIQLSESSLNDLLHGIQLSESSGHGGHHEDDKTPLLNLFKSISS